MSTPPTWQLITSRADYFLAFGCGTGLSPKAPGTVGTLLGFPLYWLLAAIFPLPVVLTALAGLYLAGHRMCEQAGLAVGVADHSGIVWDEIVAMAVVLCFTPAGWPWGLAAFAAFRLFDILKPPPIRWVDRNMKTGAGVMLDDLIAALFAITVIRLAFAII